MTRKEQILALIDKIGTQTGWTEKGWPIVFTEEDCADAILALPLDVQSEDEIDFPGHPDYGKKIYTFSKEELQEYAEAFHKEKLKNDLIHFASQRNEQHFLDWDSKYMISVNEINDFLNTKE